MRQRIAITATVRNRYRKARKKVRSKILDEFVKTTGYNRSYARFLLGSLKKRGRKKKYPPRKRRYDVKVFYGLRKLWIAADCICGRRLKPFIPELITKLQQFEEIEISKTVKQKLLTMGSATIDRILSATKKSYQLKGRSTTKPGSILKSQIPVKTFADWDEEKERPGFFETDLVAFCGESVTGDYVNGLNLTDICTGWVLLDAVMGKAQSRVFPAIESARERLPYKMLGLNPDNGSEFINWHLKRYCEKEGISFTRIRAGKKNDNSYVEQKNYTVMRLFIGYARYDTKKQLIIIKEILKLVEVYVNFFQPSLKLKSKQRLGSKVKKKYYTAKTPYQRLLKSGVLTKKQEQQLQSYYETLNPMEIRRQIHRLQKKLNKTLRWKIHDLTNT